MKKKKLWKEKKLVKEEKKFLLAKVLSDLKMENRLLTRGWMFNSLPGGSEVVSRTSGRC